MVQLSPSAGSAPRLGLSDREGLAVRVTGVVQGVGFRPFVHRLAVRHRLDGWVLNAAGEVQIEVEGAAGALQEFLDALEIEAPPLARIERVEVERHAARGLSGFAIETSQDQPGRRQPVSPDVAICAACEAELRDPANRRFEYPFITCTDCGPRFTVINAMPYDRERTSMAAFAQCPACRAEYASPGSRRYHSETNSCFVCGPRLWFAAADGAPRSAGAEEALSAAALLLFGGGILAVRGVGGFHLAVDATDERAVALLRERKRREAKPLAVMVGTLEAAARLGRGGSAEAGLLASPADVAQLGSALAVAIRFPSEENTALLTLPACPLRRSRSIPVNASNTRAVTSALAVSTLCPSGENTAVLMASRCPRRGRASST